MKFTDVIDILDRSVGGPDADVSSHGPFWRGVTRDRFVAMKVGGRKLVTLGDGAESNLVKSLRASHRSGPTSNRRRTGPASCGCPPT